MTITTKTPRRLFNIAVLCIASAFGAVALASEALSEEELKALKAQIAETRQTLDEAASRLADLNMQIFEAEYGGEKSSKPMLGVLIEDHIGGDGIRLVGVTPNMGAADVGMQAGDLMVAVNGYRLDLGDDSMAALHEAMAPVSAGDTVAVEFLRDGVTQQVDVVTEARGTFAMKMGKSLELDIDLSELEQLKQLEQLKSLEGLKSLEALKVLGQIDGMSEMEQQEILETVNEALAENGIGTVSSLSVEKLQSGLRLEQVEGDLAGYFGVDSGLVVMSAPEDSELKAGDVLLTLNGADVGSVSTVVKKLRSADEAIPASVLREGSTLDVSLAPGTGAYSSMATPVRAGAIRIRVEHDEEDKTAGSDDDS